MRRSQRWRTLRSQTHFGLRSESTKARLNVKCFVSEQSLEQSRGQLRKGASIALTALLDECMEAVVKFRNTSVLDVALIAAAQVVEHYEITCYRTLRSWAEDLQIQEAVDLIDETLGEEEKAAKVLT